MESNAPPLDVLVVGAGPIGLCCALEAQRRGLRARIVEKGALLNSLVGYPTDMEFFSTPDLLEIGGHPMPTRGYKPLRAEALDYYRGVALAENLDVRLYERVHAVEGHAGAFTVHTSKGTHACRAVVVATGFFDHPNRLDVPGEALPHVSHYYKEPYAYTGQRVAVIGAKNSAAKAALECLRHGAAVTLVVRGPALSDAVKYWIKPDLENRIREGRIRAFFHTSVVAITPDTLHLATPSGPVALATDFVLALTGYQPDLAWLEGLGLRLEGPHRAPAVDPVTLETSRPGVYAAGTVLGGLQTSRWFIENGRVHAAQIAAHLVQSLPSRPTAAAPPAPSLVGG